MRCEKKLAGARLSQQAPSRRVFLFLFLGAIFISIFFFLRCTKCFLVSFCVFVMQIHRPEDIFHVVGMSERAAPAVDKNKTIFSFEIHQE